MKNPFFFFCMLVWAAAGNASAVQKVEVSSADLSPRLFSPNGDGVLDNIQIALQIAISGTDGTSGNGKTQTRAEGEIYFNGTSGNAVLTFSEAVPTATGGNDSVVLNVIASWDGSALADGDYEVTYVARKVQITPSGQRNIKDQTSGSLGEVRIDTSAPQVALTAPSNGLFTRFLPVQVQGTVSDENGIVSVVVEGTEATIEGVEFFADLYLNEGVYTLIARATDSAGNSADSLPVQITVDLTAPQISILCPQNGIQTSAGSTSVVGDVRDNFGIASVEVNGFSASVSGVTLYVNQISLQMGDNFLVATATDLAGNVAQSTAVLVRRVLGGGLTISTWAGDGSLTFDGDNQPATLASLQLPIGLELDPDGALFIADSVHRRLRRVNSANIITTFAGTGDPGSGGDGGQAANATFANVQDVKYGPDGSLYILDLPNRKIRKVATNGIISTYAGSGGFGNTGDNGPATSATFSAPESIAVDSTGKLYIADSVSARVRVVGTDGIIRHFAGGTNSSDGIPASNARLRRPRGVFATSGNEILIADALDHKIRKVNVSGIISTVAGTGTAGFSGDGGPATGARLNQPIGASMDAANQILIADMMNNRIRKVKANGTIETAAGNGILGFGGDGGLPTNAKLNRPQRVIPNPNGGFFIADTENHRVRRIDLGGNSDETLQCTP
jgi:hypothetical protein